ncbi:PrgI family protein [Candidatus Woesebacteria bacterium]|nr:PrgI family protein [Candidatus Woesebacteria bacterium]
MDQHPIPRQITSFEFKLIGFMTLKQFLYLVISLPAGFVVFKIIPIPLINALLGLVVALVGVAFAFIPYQDRPLEEWVRNLIRRMNSPTQYYYHKNNDPVYFLKNLYFLNDPHIILAHVDSKEKLQAYLAQKKTEQPPANDKKKQQIDTLLKQPGKLLAPLSNPVTNVAPNATPSISPPLSQSVQPASSISESLKQMQGLSHQPFFTGVVKNRKQIPLPGILVSLKDKTGKQLRLLKTNPHGIFATYSPLPEGDYMFEVSDPNDAYFFDTMNIHLGAKQQPSLAFYSKEIL